MDILHPKNREQNYYHSASDFVDYPKKENHLPGIEKDHEVFFNQKEIDISCKRKITMM
jgi:hypothetical protein